MRRLLNFAVIAALFVVFSCKKADPPFLEVDSEAVEIPTEGATVSVAVRSNFEWIVESDKTWAKVKRNDEKKTVDIYVSKNSLTEDREAVLTLRSEQNAQLPTATITVTQLQKNAIRSVGTSSYVVTSDEQVLAVKLESNVGCNVEIPQEAASWLSYLAPTKAMQSVDCNIHVEANPSLQERKAEIVIKGEKCEDVSVEIVQEGRPQNLSFTLGRNGIFKLPSINTDDAEVKVLWSGQEKVYYNGLEIRVDNAPSDVVIQGRKITAVEFPGIKGLDAVDFTKLY